MISPFLTRPLAGRSDARWTWSAKPFATLALALPVTILPPPALGQTALPAAESASPQAVLDDLPPPLEDGDFVQTIRHESARFELGRRLFFDPVLSGNRNISCGTCHDPKLGTSDALALGIGEGGAGAGRGRRVEDAVTGRVPRNAQALYNVGAVEYRSFFHDGRLDANSTHVHGAGFVALDSERLPDDAEGLLARQAHFPVTSAVEMAGQPGENPVADAVARYRLAGSGGAWDLIAARLRELPGYVARFSAAFDEVTEAADIRYSHAAEALAVFQARAFRSTGSRFDRLLESRSLDGWSERERGGLALFYGKAGCSGCHSGPLLTDHGFHAIAMPQIGPGKGHGHDTSYQRSSGFADRLEDEGRYRVSREPADRFRFRTPSLRNVALSGPWGHAGAYESLEDVVRHHLDPVAALGRYARERADRALAPLHDVLDSTGRGSGRLYHPLDPTRYRAFNLRRGFVQDSEPLRSRIAEHNDLPPRALQEDEVDALVAFLHTLTDPGSRDQSYLVPASLPSGLEPQPEPPLGTP